MKVQAQHSAKVIVLKPDPLDGLEELLAMDPRAVRIACGIPHPLHKFAGPNFVDGFFADVVLDFIHDTVFKERNSMAWNGARFFLLESKSFFYWCGQGGIDGAKLRKHLRKTLGGC